MDYSFQDLEKLLRDNNNFPAIKMSGKTDISAETPRNKHKNHEERALRTLSWLHAAEKARDAKDINAQLTNTLIAFNALYAHPIQYSPPPALGDSTKNLQHGEMMTLFLRALVARDKTKILLNFLANEGRESLNAIMNNRYLPTNYWGVYMGVHPSPKQTDWKEEFIEENRNVKNLLTLLSESKNMNTLLGCLQKHEDVQKTLTLIWISDRNSLLVLLKQNKELNRLEALFKKIIKLKDASELAEKNKELEDLLEDLLALFEKNKKMEDLLALIKKDKNMGKLLVLIKEDKMKDALAFIKKDKEMRDALIYTLVHEPLKHALNRIQVLRNQMLHGGAGYNDYYNREQVKDCTEFLLPLVGRMLHIVIKNPKGWGKVPYPPQGELDQHADFPVPLEED